MSDHQPADDAPGAAWVHIDSDGRVVRADLTAWEWTGDQVAGEPLWPVLDSLTNDDALSAALRDALSRQRTLSLPLSLPGRRLQTYAHPDGMGGLHILFVPATAAERTVAELGDRIRQQEAVTELGRQALDGRPLPDFFSVVVKVASATIGVGLVAITQWVGDTVYQLAWEPPVDLRGSHPLESLVGTTWHQSLVTGESAHVQDYSKEPGGGPDTVGQFGIVSAASVPIHTAEGVWGALIVTDRVPGAIGGQELLFLQHVATLVGTAIDRSAQRQLLHWQVQHDALTQLPNQVAFRERLTATLAESPCALLLLDLKGFKDVNDALGHAIGDTVLQQVAERLSGAVDERGLTARLGGDEFGVLLPGADEASARALALSIVAAFEQPFHARLVDISLTVSIGIATSPEHGVDTTALLRHADVAMYRSKWTGVTYAVFDAQQDDAQLHRLTSLTELRRAVSKGEMRLHYQPVVDVRTGRPLHVEALVRWQHPDRGLQPPGQFVPLAEQSRIIGPLTLWVLDEASRQLEEWDRSGVHIPRVAINISPQCLQDGGVLRQVRDVLATRADRLTVELTESAVAGPEVRDALGWLSAHGVSCAIDDFGTGYASLTHLRDLAIDTLKIDRSFVHHLDTDPRDRAIVGSVVDLARALEMGIVAEGVETHEVASQLQAVGVERGQGFLWCRPIAGDELADWWRAAIS